MALVTLSMNVNQALSGLETAAKKAEKSLAKSSIHAAAIIRKNMQDVMPQGRAGQAEEYQPGKFRRVRERSKPGQPPFKQSGKLARSLRFEKTESGGARIYSAYKGTGKRKENSFLARIMGSGTVSMAPRPFTRPAVNKSLARIPTLMKTEIAKEGF